MTEKVIIENLLQRTGQSQAQRTTAELDVHFADVDERSKEDFMLFAAKFSEFVNHYNESNTEVPGNWSNFFPGSIEEIRKIIAQNDGTVTPHLALYMAFLELYAEPQNAINTLTGAHLDFYYRDVLRFTKKDPVPDKVHVIAELKKNEAPFEIKPATSFTAGKDVLKNELLYHSTETTIVNNSKIEAIKSIFVDFDETGSIYNSPVSKSKDGIGKQFDVPEPKWSAFGNKDLPLASVGFALSSPVLRMKEGTRKVTIVLKVSFPTDQDNSVFNDAFEAFITGEKGWIGPFALKMEAGADDEISLSFTIDSSLPAIIDYEVVKHGFTFVATSPIVQLLFKNGNINSVYSAFKDISVISVSLKVDVTDCKSLTISNDLGNIDPKKAFMPFGPQPVKGSLLEIGCDEALSKSLDELSIQISWKDAPENFKTRYNGYDTKVDNPFFKVGVSFEDADDWTISGRKVQLFDSDNADQLHVIQFTKPVKAEKRNGSGKRWLMYHSNSALMKKAKLHEEKNQSSHTLNKNEASPNMDAGDISLKLESSFLHEEYRKLNTQKILNFTKSTTEKNIDLLNEPYTPVIQQVSISYKAQSDVALISISGENFSLNDVQFHQIGCFGSRLDHASLHKQYDADGDQSIYLLPHYSNEGELLIGLSNISAGDSASILFQVAEGSEDPEILPESINWSVLSNNFWKPLGSSQLVSDTTNRFLCSGIIKFVIPAEATVQNTIMPAGMIWLRATISKNSKSCCQLLDILSNAIELKFHDNNNDPSHLDRPLEKNKITKLKESIPAIKSISQPYSSFGGRPVESDNFFHTRVSERLRHKNRCITVWDYERMILEAFPSVHKVKCIPHSAYNPAKNSYCWLSPGNIVIVVVPDLTNKNSVNPFRPRLDSNTISQLNDFVTEHSGMQVNVKVKNPKYQEIEFRFGVRFKRGFEFNFYSEKLNQEIKEYLTPWAFNKDAELEFGGKIHKSTLLNFVEEQEYVDYITDFQMITYIDSESGIIASEVEEATPATPDSILVSKNKHTIFEI